LEKEFAGMANLFIAYDLDKPGQNYAGVEKAIKSLGSWAHVQLSVWYVHTPYGAQHAAQFIRKEMDSNDRLLVIDASDAYWYNPIAEEKFIQEHWRA
jgi:hypothetical protein